PTGLRKGTLFVTVDHSVWLSEIVRRSQSQRFKENGAHLSGDRVCYRKWLFFFLFFALLSVRIT
ncbi:MAG: hypothetical protein HYY23_18385, partial [Verrucomicrobia bacterium]|nr:hypothetical protein [Verrucomicrobiota bacterium]